MGLLDRLFIQVADKRHIRKLLVEEYVRTSSSYSDAKSIVKQMSRFQLYSTPIASVFLMVKKYIGYRDTYEDDNRIFSIMDEERREFGFTTPRSPLYSDIYDYTYKNLLENTPQALRPEVDFQIMTRIWTNSSAIAIFSFYRHLRRHAEAFD